MECSENHNDPYFLDLGTFFSNIPDPLKDKRNLWK